MEAVMENMHHAMEYSVSKSILMGLACIAEP